MSDFEGTEYEEEIIEIDEDGNEWLVEVEEYEEEVDEDDGLDEFPSTVVVSNLHALDRDDRHSNGMLTSNHSRGVQSQTPTVLISNTRKSNNTNGVLQQQRGPRPSGVELPEPPKDKSTMGGLGSRFKNLMKRPEPIVENKNRPEQQSQETVAPPQPTLPPTKVKKTRQVKRIRKKTDSNDGVTSPTASTTNAEGGGAPSSEDPAQQQEQTKAIYTLSIVRDETTGRELSRTVTGRKPPHYQPQGPNEKRYTTKLYRKTRVNPINRHKEVEETTVTYEKPRSPIFEQTLPASALKPTNEWNPARKTTEWEKPSWVKNKMEVGSSIKDGANLEKPITAATKSTARKNAGALSFTIERA